MWAFFVLFNVLLFSTLVVSASCDCLESNNRTYECIQSIVRRKAVDERRANWNTNDEECKELMDEFACLVSDFVWCSVKSARPFTVCEKCLGFYNNVTAAYQQIMTKINNDSSTCEESLLNSDKIQVIRHWYNGMEQLWSDSQCGVCFTSYVDGEGHLVYALSNDTLQFDQYMNETLDCIGNATNKTFTVPAGHSCNSSSVCHKCAVQYKRLNKFYNSLADSADQLCMDVVDKMNASRILWSEHLLCVHHTNPVLTVFISIGGMAFLPILFYFFVWWRSVRQEQCIVPQKRLVSSQEPSVSGN